MTVNKKKDPHPIVKKAFEFAREGFEPIEIDNYAVEQLQEILKQSFGKPDLVTAVVDLINLAGILREENSPTAAMQLIRVVVIAAKELEKLKKKGIT
jgi:hypothetical protein